MSGYVCPGCATLRPPGTTCPKCSRPGIAATSVRAGWATPLPCDKCGASWEACKARVLACCWACRHWQPRRAAVASTAHRLAPQPERISR